MRRITAILLPYYFVYFLAIFVTVIIDQSSDLLNLEKLLRVVFVVPNHDEMPFPLGQIWFIRVLLFAFVVSPFIFLIYRKKD